MIVCHSVALEIQGYLTLRCSLKLTPRIYNIRASFCPLLSLEKGEYIGVHVCLSFVHLSVSKKAIFFFSLCVLLKVLSRMGIFNWYVHCFVSKVFLQVIVIALDDCVQELILIHQACRRKSGLLKCLELLEVGYVSSYMTWYTNYEHL